MRDLRGSLPLTVIKPMAPIPSETRLDKYLLRWFLRAESGHIAPGRRASLVDAVLALPEVQESACLKASFALGDSESLQRLQQRCADVSTRSAGWSALIDAKLPSGGADSTAQQSAGEEAPSE
jgi:hypothetical protein